MLHPMMLTLGGLAVSVPIIIHLLNKRRFKIVEWAAMDFLLEADKKNRRRVQLENFILLALRCLAMLLLGLLLSRPFLPSAISSILGQKEQFERVVLLDDSLSLSVLTNNEPALEGAKAGLKQLLTDLADTDRSDDWLTMFLTSDSEQPLLANEPVTRGTLPALLDTIDRIRITDESADYSQALSQVNRYVAGQRENISRVVYVFTDLRERDWQVQSGTSVENSPNRFIQQIGTKTGRGFLVDVGSANDQNVGIVNLRSDDLLVANRIVRFQVDVASFSSQTLNNIRVLLQIDEQPPVSEVIGSLAPGSVESVTFRYLFRPPPMDNIAATTADMPPSGSLRPSNWQNHRVRAELDQQSFSAEQLSANQMLDDDTRYLAARIHNGIPVLLVDGDPSIDSQRSDTHYLKHLDIFGTGLNTKSVTTNDLETISLSEFRVIFLCNVDEVSADRVRAVEQWVHDGGSLVFMPGNQVRAATFNETFFRGGTGIAPFELEKVAGDPTMSSWVNFEVDPQLHPALRTVVESDAASIGKVDVFSWWTTKIPEGQVDSTIVPVRLSDEAHSAAMVERNWGSGKVVAFSFPGDGDWSVFPGMDAVFVPIMLDLIDYLVGNTNQASAVSLGGSIKFPIDLTAYQNRVTLRDPQNEKEEMIARPVDETEEAAKSVIYQAQFDDILRRGFYELGLLRTSGEAETVLFAANVQPDEGRLKRLNLTTVESDFWGDKFSTIPVSSLTSQKVPGKTAEMWPQVVWILLLILGTEQFLAWWFGKRR
jgi:hypothetical protein